MHWPDASLCPILLTFVSRVSGSAWIRSDTLLKHTIPALAQRSSLPSPALPWAPHTRNRMRRLQDCNKMKFLVLNVLATAERMEADRLGVTHLRNYADPSSSRVQRSTNYSPCVFSTKVLLPPPPPLRQSPLLRQTPNPRRQPPGVFKSAAGLEKPLPPRQCFPAG